MNTNNSVVMWTYDSWAWVCEGVDPKFAGNGGAECVDFLSVNQRVIETAIFVALCTLEAWFAWRHIKDVPSYDAGDLDRTERFGKRFLLIMLCMTFGVEIGFKFASKTAIYLLNPCHMLTVVQIYLLAAPPSRLVTIVFRMQMASLSCPLLAILFPVVNTRLLPFEPEVYWIQHFLIYVIIPPYLTSLGGVYRMEKFWDFSWIFFTSGVLFNYHYLVLQSLGILTQVNLNSMVCPAMSDPFYGPFYRVFAFFHQHALLPVHSKIYMFIVRSLVEPSGDDSSEQCNGGMAKKED